MLQTVNTPVVHALTDAHLSSCLQGHIDTDYATLTAVFGEHNSWGDEYKIQVQWKIIFSDGTYATIYDWKEGDAYLGQDKGTLPLYVTDWHIGGSSPLAVERVCAAVSQYLDAVCVK